MVQNNSFACFISKKIEMRSMSLSLARIEKALNEISFNEKDLGFIIHVAGTNGKGTTVYFISNMLINSGYNVASFYSPHIEKINERIVYNNENISSDELEDIYKQLAKVIIKYDLTYFETLTLIAFYYFSKQKPDYTVIETGLGGRLDATNVLVNKLPVITNISYDHPHILGRKIYKIIDEKLAIVKNNNVVFVGNNEKFIRDYILEKLVYKKVFFTSYNYELINNVINTLPKVDKYSYPYPYYYDFLLALRIFNYLTNRVYDGKAIELPLCRFERFGNIIFDGTHTINGLLQLFKNFNSNSKTSVLFSLTKERNLEKFIAVLTKYSNNIVLTTIPFNNRSISIDTLNNIDTYKQKKLKFIGDPLKGLTYLNREEKQTILVTGSFYLCAYLRGQVIKK
ncbi:MAG: Mur ligase family protein [Deferribacterota bacterium]|nr:Mur ligase family protein [Deferribacterota bacterium]